MVCSCNRCCYMFVCRAGVLHQCSCHGCVVSHPHCSVCRRGFDWYGRVFASAVPVAVAACGSMFGCCHDCFRGFFTSVALRPGERLAVGHSLFLMSGRIHVGCGHDGFRGCFTQVSRVSWCVRPGERLAVGHSLYSCP